MVTKFGAYRSMAQILGFHGKRNALSHHVVRGGRYEDSVVIGKYRVEYDRSDDGTRILIWNPDKPCMAINIHRTDGATLDLLEYDRRCEVRGKMVRGAGTREMIQFAFDILKKEGVNKVQLSDYSTFRCGASEIPLGIFYFILHGKTWYEKYFNAYPIKQQEAYKRSKQLRTEKLDIDFLKSQPCEYFTVDRLEEIGAIIKFPSLDRIPWEIDLTQ